MLDKPWGRRLLQPAIVGGMMACIALSVTQFIHLFAPDWNGTLLIIMPVLVVFVAHESSQIAHQRYLSGTDLFRFQAIELLTLFVVVKVAGYLDNTLLEILAEIRGWGKDPISLLDLETLMIFILTSAGWITAWNTANDLEELADPTPYEGRDYSRPIRRLQGKFFLGGLCLLLFSGLTRTQYIEILKVTRPALPALAFNALLYFVGGLIVLGQLRFARQTRLWRTQKVHFTPALSKHWMQYTLILLGIVLVIAFLLPTGYTIGFLEMINLVIGALVYLVSFLFFLLMLPLSYLMSLFTDSTPTAQPLPMPGPFTPEPISSAGITPSPWGEVLRSILFWLIALAALGYVLRSYWKDRPELWAKLRRFRPLALLLDAFRRVWKWWRRIGHDLGSQLERVAARLRVWQPRAGQKDGQRQKGQSQREQVFYYYLSTLDQAQEAGTPRRQNQTPYEYHETLTPQLPEAQDALVELTEAFVEARYSEHPVDPKSLAEARDAARQVQTALQTLTDQRYIK